MGSGRFSAFVGLEGQESYLASGRTVVFNSRLAGRPVLYGQIYSSYPFAHSFVIVFKVARHRKGAYGTALTASVPKNLRAWGNLTEIRMRLSRRFAYRGERRSFLTAACPTPKGFDSAVFRLARTNLAFSGGARLSSTLTDECRVRR